MGVSTPIFLIQLLVATLLGGKDESQGMVGMIKTRENFKALISWRQVQRTYSVHSVLFFLADHSLCFDHPYPMLEFNCPQVCGIYSTGDKVSANY